jgi:hypothetical protein
MGYVGSGLKLTSTVLFDTMVSAYTSSHPNMPENLLMVASVLPQLPRFVPNLVHLAQLMNLSHHTNKYQSQS